MRVKFTFLLYINRSGSTFLSNEISKVDEILVCPEADVLVNQLLKKSESPFNEIEKKKTTEILASDHKLRYWNLDYSELGSSSYGRMELFFVLLKKYQQSIKPNARIILFKAVDLMYQIEKLKHYASANGLEVSFILLNRHPCGIFNSQYRTYVEHRGRLMNRNPLEMINQWKYLVSVMDQYASYGPFFTIKYENLVMEPEANIRRILSFLNVADAGYSMEKEGNLRIRMPKDQLIMHLFMEYLPMPDKITKWHDELSFPIQYFIQKMAKREMLSLDYPLNQIKKPGNVFYLLWIRYKCEMVLKIIYSKLRRFLKY